MDNKIEGIKLTLASTLSLLASVLGDTYKWLLALIILMIIDTIMGWIKGFKNGDWKSKNARWGFGGKIVELILIAVLYVLDWLFGTSYIAYIGLSYFAICEIGSIFENYAEINGNLPTGFLDILKKLQYNVGTKTVEKIKKIIDNIFNDGGNGNENK